METKKIIADKLLKIKSNVKELILELNNIVDNPILHKLVVISYFSQINLFIEKSNFDFDINQAFGIYNNLFENSKPFTIKFTNATMSDEFIGTLVKKELDNGNYNINTLGFAPSSNFVLLEDVSKSNPIIKSDLIDLISYNRYLNNNSYEKTNNYLKIIYDNKEWFIDNINQPFFKMFNSDDSTIKIFNFKGVTKTDLSNKFLFSDISFINNLVNNVEIPNEIDSILQEFYRKIDEINFYRSEKIILRDLDGIIKKIIKVSSLLNGRLEPNITDCFFIHHLASSSYETQKILLDTFNLVSSKYEYDIQFEESDIIYYYNNLIKLIKSEIIEKSKNSISLINKVFKNDVGEYYVYTSLDDEKKFFIRKIVLDEILNGKNLKEMYTIRYATFEEFIDSRLENNKINFYLESINAFTYQNNKKIYLVPTTEEKKVEKFNNKNIMEDSIKEIKKSSIILVQKIDYHISKLNELLNLDLNRLFEINPLILSENMDFYKKPITSAISKLYFLRSSINEIFANLKLFVKDNNFEKMNNFTKMILL